MAFGVLFDFTGNSNVSKVTKAADMVQETWFKDAVNYKEPIDLFVLTGHNPVRFNVSSSSFKTVFSAIRSARPDVPIQGFGGHTHIRDFTVWDDKATALESGEFHIESSGKIHFLTPIRSLLRDRRIFVNVGHRIFRKEGQDKSQGGPEPDSTCIGYQQWQHYS
jgi:hypothetical protein